MNKEINHQFIAGSDKEFVIIPRCGVYDERLSDGTLRLLAMFYDHLDGDHVDGLSFPKMAKALNKSKKMLSREIAELEEQGYIIIQRGRPYQTHRYVIRHFTLDRSGDTGIKQEINDTAKPLDPNRTNLAGPGAVEVVQGGGGDRRSPSSLSSRNPLDLPAESEQVEDLRPELYRLPSDHPLRKAVNRRLLSAALRHLVRFPPEGVSCFKIYLAIIYHLSVLGMSQDDETLCGKVEVFLADHRLCDSDVLHKLKENIERRVEKFETSGVYTVNIADLELQILQQYQDGVETDEREA